MTRKFFSNEERSIRVIIASMAATVQSRHNSMTHGESRNVKIISHSQKIIISAHAMVVRNIMVVIARYGNWNYYGCHCSKLVLLGSSNYI